MKKIILLGLLYSSLVFATAQQTLIKQISQQSQNLETVNLTNKGEEKTSNEISNFVQESTKNEIKLEDFKDEKVKNEVIEVKETKNQSIYAEYFGNHLKKNEDTRLFGMDIVNNAKDKIIPTSISKDYILGVGDIISVKIWSDLFTGNADSSQILPMEVSKNGTLFIPNVGSFFVNGKSIKTFEKDLIAEARKKVKFFNAEVSLEKIREISIFVVGEVNLPGHLLVNSYGNLLNVLQKSGGITERASLRNIKIIREGEELTVDLYPYLLGNGNVDSIKIKDGDTIYIPVLQKKVLIEGAVNRPAYYEIGKEKDYKNLVNLAGGFTQLASRENIEIYSILGSSVKMETVKLDNSVNNDVFKINVNEIDKNNRNEIYILGAVVNPNVYSYEKEMKFSTLLQKSGGLIKESTQNFVTIIRGKENRKVINFNPKVEDITLQLGDEVYVYNYNDINNKAYANINGAILKEGNYEVFEGSRVLNLIYSARGLDHSKNPFMNRADLYRVDEEGRLKVFKIDLNKLLNGDEKENILLRRNDVLKIYTYDEVVKHDEIYIYGEVREEGKYRYYQNMTLEDIVFYSKGLQNRADKNITINRHENNKIQEYVIDIERNPDFKILPGDIVFVRKKSDWIDNKLVKLEGFVKYPGVYQLNPSETMNTLITRAGGFTKGAFPQGTKFTRKKENYVIDEKTKETKIVESFESVSNFDFNEGNNAYVRDIELINGDAIYIPEKPTTVKIEGEVYTPGLIVFDSKMDNYKDYVEAAGGYKETAYKSRTFVIKANGKTVAKPSKTKIEPGDTIYVPLDAREKKGLDRGIELFKGTLEIVSTVALIILLF